MPRLWSDPFLGFFLWHLYEDARHSVVDIVLSDMTSRGSNKRRNSGRIRAASGCV